MYRFATVHGVTDRRQYMMPIANHHICKRRVRSAKNSSGDSDLIMFQNRTTSLAVIT